MSLQNSSKMPTTKSSDLDTRMLPCKCLAARGLGWTSDSSVHSCHRTCYPRTDTAVSVQQTTHVLPMPCLTRFSPTSALHYLHDARLQTELHSTSVAPRCTAAVSDGTAAHPVHCQQVAKPQQGQQLSLLPSAGHEASTYLACKHPGSQVAQWQLYLRCSWHTYYHFNRQVWQ